MIQQKLTNKLTSYLNLTCSSLSFIPNSWSLTELIYHQFSLWWAIQNPTHHRIVLFLFPPTHTTTTRNANIVFQNATLRFLSLFTLLINPCTNFSAWVMNVVDHQLKFVQNQPRICISRKIATKKGRQKLIPQSMRSATD